MKNNKVIQKIKKEMKNWFSFPCNYTTLDFKYYKQVKISLIYDMIYKSLTYTLKLIIFVSLLSYAPNFDKSKFTEYFILFMIMILLIRFLIFITGINVKNIEIQDVKNFKSFKNNWDVIALTVLIIVLNESLGDSSMIDITKAFKIGILVELIIQFSSNLTFFLFKKIPRQYYNGELLIKKQECLDKFKYRNVGSPTLKDECNKFYSSYIHLESKVNIINPRLENEEWLELDENRVISYALFNDDITTEIFYKLYTELDAKIIDLSNENMENKKLYQYDIEDKTKTLIFINGDKMNISDFEKMIINHESQRSYIYINGKAKFAPYYNKYYLSNKNNYKI